ncbi:MAG: hypothetical protein H7Y37_02020 [Anaerolineae bacterium]|nr:hypothetical protein [Gloeobacterales cyanobacterium ES-bin-313]
MANGTKGKGRAPPSGLPPRGGQTACPPHPLGNFSPDNRTHSWRNAAQVAAGQVRETPSLRV